MSVCAFVGVRLYSRSHLSLWAIVGVRICRCAPLSVCATIGVRVCPVRICVIAELSVRVCRVRDCLVRVCHGTPPTTFSFFTHITQCFSNLLVWRTGRNWIFSIAPRTGALFSLYLHGSEMVFPFISFIYLLINKKWQILLLVANGGYNYIQGRIQGGSSYVRTRIYDNFVFFWEFVPFYQSYVYVRLLR